MRMINVYYNDIKAGELTELYNYYMEHVSGYQFDYDEDYLKSNNPSVSLTLPKRKKEYISKDFFPCFSNMYCFHKGKMIEVNDFDTLYECKGDDFIGAINVK